MQRTRWPYYDPEFHTLYQRINPSSVKVDNTSCPNATIIKVDSRNKNGILAEMMQILSDLDLNICKAHISSDGGWFMDVFHVTDRLGNKFRNEQLLIDHVHKVLGSKQALEQPQQEVTVIELIGRDRPGLVSEISAVLKDMDCNVVTADVWTHNSILAANFYVTDISYGHAIKDSLWLSVIHDQLRKLINANLPQGNVNNLPSVRIYLSCIQSSDRHMHQLMVAYHDYETPLKSNDNPCSCNSALVSIEDWVEKSYSVVNVRCKDRPRLLYDTVCTLTDLEYVIFHATIDCNGPEAMQEYYIRHMDGRPIETEGERQRVIKCMKAAIKRRVSEGGRFELCMRDRVGLLSHISHILRENGLSIAAAMIRTVGYKAVNVFYVNNSFGGPLDLKNVEAVRNEFSKYISALEIGSQLLPPFPSELLSSMARPLSCEFKYEDQCHCVAVADVQSQSFFAKILKKPSEFLFWLLHIEAGPHRFNQKMIEGELLS